MSYRDTDEPLLESSYDSTNEKALLPRMPRSRLHGLLSIKTVVISTAIVASVVMSYVAQGWKLDRESADAMVALNLPVTPEFFGAKTIDSYGRLRRQATSVTCSSGPVALNMPTSVSAGMYDWSDNAICMDNARRHANCIRVCDDSFSTCDGCAALQADRDAQYAEAISHCAFKSAFVCPLDTVTGGTYDYVGLSKCCLESKVPTADACMCDYQQSSSALCFLNGVCSGLATCQKQSQTCIGSFSTAPLAICTVPGALTCTGTGSSEVDLTCGTVGGNQYYLNSATSLCVSTCPTGFVNTVVGGLGTCPATVAGTAKIQVSAGNDVLGYVGDASSGAYSISSSALAFSLPDSNTDGSIGIAQNGGGYLDASVDPNQILSSGTSGSSRLRARFSKERLSKRTLTTDQVTAYVATQAAPDAAYLAIVDAAALAYTTAASAAWNAAFAITGASFAAPALAAESTYATSTVMASWTACVAYKAAWTTTYTAYDAAAYPGNPTSVAADAAALAIATAEAAGAGPTSDSSCGRMALLYATAYSPSDASAAAVNSHAAALAIKAELAAAVTPAAVVAAPVAGAGAASALIIPSSTENKMWSIDPDTKILTATYTNADTSVVHNVIFFAKGNNLGVTGNLKAYNAFAQTNYSPLVLTWIP